MKAKELLRRAFTIRKGREYQTIVQSVTSGEIKPNSSYIQTFDEYTFFTISPDVEFITKAGEKCYLYKVD